MPTPTNGMVAGMEIVLILKRRFPNLPLEEASALARQILQAIYGETGTKIGGTD